MITPMLWYNGDVINQKLMALAGARTPDRASPRPTQKRCATMDKPIVSQRKNQWKPEDYHALAAQHGLKWLGPYTGKIILPTTWECSKGHQFEMPFVNLVRNHSGCPECRYVLPEQYHALAASRGYIWLGPEVGTTMVKTWWQCSDGHKWESSYNALQGCPTCWYLRWSKESRHSAEDYHEAALERGLKWLGIEVPRTNEPTEWICENGHKFTMSYRSVIRGRKCYDCLLAERSEQRRVKPEQYHAMAELRGMVWLGPEVDKTRYKTWWMCPSGHKWFAPYDALRKGSSCPECQDMVNGRQVSKMQRILCDMVGGELNYKIGRCTADVVVFVGDTKIVIEYDCDYWHAKTLANDRRRAQYMIRRGWKVISVKSSTKLPSLEQLHDAFRSLANGESYCEVVLDDWCKRGRAHGY